jgi:hypothetical protein
MTLSYQNDDFLYENDLLIHIRLDFSKQEQTEYEIEYIVGGGRSSKILWWNWDVGIEIRNVNYFSEKIKAFCRANNYTIIVTDVTP